jgi:hypothetical protein
MEACRLSWSQLLPSMLHSPSQYAPEQSSTSIPMTTSKRDIFELSYFSLDTAVSPLKMRSHSRLIAPIVS